jgi:hypothetical protein
VTLGARAAGTAAAPAVLAWRSPLAEPARRRATEAAAALTYDGRAFATQIRDSASVAAGYRLRVLGERLLRSKTLEEVTTRVLESEEMRLVLQHITHSPELRAALADQSAGLAGDMADGMRSRTEVADATAERFARSLIRRRPRADASARDVAPVGDVMSPSDVAP